MPTKAKGRKYQFELSCVAWGDLLGYGSMLELAQFHPDDPIASKAIQRLRSFQQIAMEEATTRFRVMPINDGVAFFCDLTPRTTSVTADFLQRAIRAFQKINEEDQRSGHPGFRMVISVGPRARIARPKRSSSHLRHIFTRLSDGSISTQQAVNEAFISGPIAGFVPHLQANFAFSRAYLAESGGSKKGFKGANCFVDMTLFDNHFPEWIQFRRINKWNDRGFSAHFGEFECANWVEAGRTSYLGLASTISIAEKLGMGNSYGVQNTF